jgi:serine/tyrosine/threonine adenylyltransferase
MVYIDLMDNGSLSAAPRLPLDGLRHDPRITELGADYYSVVPPTPVPEPHLVAFNPDAAALIDLDPAEAARPEFVEAMAGNRPLSGGLSLSLLYAGHQFGVFVPQLGDGRAILVGQVRNSRGELWELQLKGAGKTPYSRFGDGRAVLRSTIREYLCGEAMHGLGIPTTRALCIVGSPEPVQRETVETAAILCRMAPSHLRFGNFEVFYYRNQHDKLAPLADHIIRTYFGSRPWAAPTKEGTAAAAHGRDPQDPVGAAHGRDETRDTPVGAAHGRDEIRDTPVGAAHGRDEIPDTAVGAAHGRDPQNPVGAAHGRDVYRAFLTEVVERTARLIAQWQAVGFCHGVMNTDNMSILGLTLDYGPYGFLDAFDADFICNHSDEGGRYAYDQQPGIGHWNCSRLLQATLPLLHETPEEAVKIAYAILERYGAVFTEAMRGHWRAKLGLAEARDEDPALINELLAILDRSKADFTTVFRLLAEVTAGHATVRDHVADLAAFDGWLAKYRQRLALEGSDDAARRARMNRVNPKYVLRNHLAQAAIDQARAGDFSGIERLRLLLARPFDEQPGMEQYARPPPPDAARIEVSCSS